MTASTATDPKPLPTIRRREGIPVEVCTTLRKEDCFKNF